MAGEATITIYGNLTADPELRFTPSGAAVANFTVAMTPRNKDGDQWVDGEATFYRVAVWRQAAEHVAESLQRGDAVLVYGRLKTRSYETKEGEKRLSLEVDAEEIGASLKFATAKVTKASRGGGGGQQQQVPSRQQGGQQKAQRGAPASDPWASGSNDPWGAAPAGF